jgi:hypothetical protein
MSFSAALQLAKVNQQNTFFETLKKPPFQPD